jgi:hypothetical protein
MADDPKEGRCCTWLEPQVHLVSPSRVSSSTISQKTRKDKVMKTFSFFLLLLASVEFLLMGCSDNSSPVVSPTNQAINSPSGSMGLAKATLTYFTGTDVFLYPISYITAERGNRTKLTMEIVDEVEAMSVTVPSVKLPFVSGTADITGKGTLDENGEGTFFGKFTLTPDPVTVGGYWEGTAEGLIRGGILSFKAVGQGKGGAIDKMQLSFKEDLDQSTYVGVITEGYYKSH